MKPIIDETTESFDRQVETMLGLREKSEAYKQLFMDKELRDLMIASEELNPKLADFLGILSDISEISGLAERARELDGFAQAAERLARAQSGEFDFVPRTTFTPPPAPLPDPADVPLDKGLEDALIAAGLGNQPPPQEPPPKAEIELGPNASEFFTITRERALNQGFDIN